MKNIRSMVLRRAHRFMRALRGRNILVNAAAAAVTTARSAEHWKRKTALAIHADPGLSDEDLEAKHDAHMALLTKALGNDADMPAGPAEIAAANERATTAETALTNEKTRATEFETALKAEKTAKEAAAETLKNEKARADEAVEALANERKVVAADLIANAIGMGRVKPADKATWETAFTKDFGAARTKLANERAVIVKVTPLTANLGQRQNDEQAGALKNEQERADKVKALINEKMSKDSSMSYDGAFSAVRREQPALFEAMTQPEAKK